MLLFPGQFAEQAPPLGLIETVAVWLIFAVTLANGASALLECGFTWCPCTTSCFTSRPEPRSAGSRSELGEDGVVDGL